MNKTEHKHTWPRPSKFSSLILWTAARDTTVGCFLHFVLRKLEDMRILFHFRSFQADVDTFIAVSWNYITRYVNFQGLFPWSSIYQLKTRERITCTRLHDWPHILGKYELNSAHRRCTSISWLCLERFLDFLSCCVWCNVDCVYRVQQAEAVNITQCGVLLGILTEIGLFCVVDSYVARSFRQLLHLGVSSQAH